MRHLGYTTRTTPPAKGWQAWPAGTGLIDPLLRTIARLMAWTMTLHAVISGTFATEQERATVENAIPRSPRPAPLQNPDSQQRERNIAVHGRHLSMRWE